MSDFWVGPVDAPDTYRLVSLLGGGGEGEVWQGVLPLSEGGRRTVAIKIARPRPGQQAHWGSFGHLLQSLSHPGLVRVTDVFLGPAMHRRGTVTAAVTGTAGDLERLSRYVVMDHIEGTNLREWVAENPEANASRRLRLLSMVAAALDTMHSGATTEVPVAHGDVKPANIVVRSDGAAILVDLGLARLTDAQGVAGRSAAYAAPELRRKGFQATPAADRYAFAVSTAQVLTGQAPPVGEDGWLDPDALRAMLAAAPLTARRPVLVDRVMALIAAAAEQRTGELRPWLDSALESLSHVTNADPADPEPTAAPSRAAGSTAPSDPAVTSGGFTPPGHTAPTPVDPAASPLPPTTAASPTPAASARVASAPPAHPPAAPEPRADDDGRELFGPYRLEELIGRGGMGEVYRATDTSRNRVVALKRLPAGMADDPEFNARFREESRLAAQLNEPHIIPIHDFGEIAGRLFIDMRLVEGTDLSQLLAAHGALSPGRAVGIVRQIASALDAAHAADLVHRDVKPANVLLRGGASTVTGTDLDEGDDFAYLVDFGIARATSNTRPGLTATGSAIGSVTYMAPERFSGRSDPRGDVYSLGCLLYETLTGRQPFPTSDTAAAIHAHLYQPAPKPSETRPGVPAAFDDVVAMALAKQPDHRYRSAGALAAAARTALSAPAPTPAPAPADASGAATPRFAPATQPAPTVHPQSSHPQPGYPHTSHPQSSHPQSSHPQSSHPQSSHLQSGPAPASPTGPHRGPTAPAAPRYGAPRTAPATYWPDPPAQTVMTPGQPRHRSNTRLAAAVVALVLAVAAMGAYALYGRPHDNGTGGTGGTGTGGGGQSVAAEVVVQEPILTRGANPFTPSVGRDAPGTVQPDGSRGRYAGSTPGLYAGTRRGADCDRATMVSFLRANPDRAAAWAGVQNLRAADLPAYIGTLTPLILRADTAVTDHGYAAGKATALPSVLQAGTAVLVDATGVPRARCASGNPLTEAAPTAGARYEPAAWPTFDPADVVTVGPSSTPIREFRFVDLSSGNAFLRPAGSGGDRDHA